MPRAVALSIGSMREDHMAMTSIRCPVLGGHVTQVTDLEGTVTRIICTEYEGSNGACRLKKAALEGGPLAQLLERMSEDTLNSRSSVCVLRAT
jgi:hypothetical protein